MESMTIKEFMQRDFKDERKRKQKQLAIKITKVTVLGAGIFLLNFDLVSANTGIDVAAQKIYSKVLLIGKWIIIVKGAIDTINHMVKGEADIAKKSFLGYLIVYIILQGLPWAMSEIDKLFLEM